MKKNNNLSPITIDKTNKVQIPRRLSPLPRPIVKNHLDKLEKLNQTLTSRTKRPQRTRKALPPIPQSSRIRQQNNTLGKPVLKSPTLSQLIQIYEEVGKQNANNPRQTRRTRRHSSAHR